MTVEAKGGCLCGGVRYQVHSKPIRTTVCHCKFCQRSTGSAYHVAPVFMKEDFEVTVGELSRYDHKSNGSGKLVHLNFCANCGTKIFLSLERFKGTVGVFGGTFDDPNHFAAGSPVSKQIFLASGRIGSIVPPHVESFWQHAINNDNTPIEPIVFKKAFTLK